MKSPTIIRNSDPNARNLEWESLPTVGECPYRRRDLQRLRVALVCFAIVVALIAALAVAG